jgi:hypothetical protein
MYLLSEQLQVARPATACQAVTSPLGLPSPDPAMVITPLLGSLSPLYELYASQIAAIVFASGYAGRAVVVGLALRKRPGGTDGEDREEDDDEREKERFIGVMDAVGECVR